MIRYLKQEEKSATRGMYEENFPEDTKAFVDYYYDWKLKDNRVVVMEAESPVFRQKAERFQVMIHQNPYTLQMCDELIEVDYIVAVATDASVRRQGKMAEVMKWTLQNMAAEHRPFTFLIPANPDVYTSSGFAFVLGEAYEAYQEQLRLALQPLLQAAELTETNSWRKTVGENIVLREAEQKDVARMTAFANTLLQKEQEIFPWRTEAYYTRMLMELRSEGGALVLMEQQDRIVGSFSYGIEGTQAELQEILIEPEYQKAFGALAAAYLNGRQIHITEMRYMVRILDLRLLGLLLRSEEPFSLKVQVRDAIIPANNGCFEIRADAAGSSIAVIQPEETEDSMDISRLTEILFEKVKLYVREWV